MIRKLMSTMLQQFRRAGINWLMASGAPQQCVNAFTVTGDGSDPLPILFASQYVEGEQLPNMATAAYVVTLHGEFTGTGEIDESTKATTGFSVTGVGNNEVINIVVVGRTNGMPQVN